MSMRDEPNNKRTKEMAAVDGTVSDNMWKKIVNMFSDPVCKVHDGETRLGAFDVSTPVTCHGKHA